MDFNDKMANLGLKKNKRGVWYRTASGQTASKSEVASKMMEAQGFKQNKRNVWYRTASGQTAKKSEVEAAKSNVENWKAGKDINPVKKPITTKATSRTTTTRKPPKVSRSKAEIAAASNKLKNDNFWNRVSENKSKYTGFFAWAKGSYTGRNRVPKEQRTQAITGATGTNNMMEAYDKYKKSDAGKLYEAIMAIDEDTLINEFSGFLVGKSGDIGGYIEWLRTLDREQIYEEAKAQSNRWIARYGM